MAANQNVILLYNSEFGSKGSGNGQFDYPTGICVANNQLFIVDKQNHRINIFDLAGDFVSSFGTFGTGSDNFSFPEFIIADDTHVYISDSANHRIKQHDFTGAYVSEFGTRGSGDSQFEYPMALTIYNEKLYIVDKQNNRVKVHQKNGTYESQITGFNFPEGITNINDKIIVSDSANRKIKYYTPGLSFLFDANTTFSYPTQVREIDGVLAVVEKQNSHLTFLDDLGNKISDFGEEGSGQNRFNFPYDLVYDNNLLFVSDSFNYRIQVFDATIEDDVPIYSGEILEQTKQLYPTGRAWWMKKSSIFELFHLGLSYSESRATSFIRELLDKIIPDNENFDENDATRWESALGLFISSNTPLEDRKDGIIRKMQYPGSVPARQHYKFVEGQLRLAGFEVYVHENRFGDPPQVALSLQTSNYGLINYGQSNYGVEALSDAEKIANYIDAERDEDFNFGDDINARATFFIGGENYPDRSYVLRSRKDEFRELILKLKPAQTAGLLLIDYVDSTDGIGFDLVGVDMEVY
jgi:hypothetical protein